MLDRAATKVLVAEDGFLASAAITRCLERAGYTVVGAAPNGMKAVEMTAELKPDVVLMDIQMPRLGGLDAARIIQENRPTPIVILTAHDSASLVDKAAEVGVGAYLTKPPESAAIDRAIAVAMARHQDFMELRRLNKELESQKKQLEEARDTVKTLKGVIPICSHCKGIRNDAGYWERLEEYIARNSDAELSHGLCPSCLQKHYGVTLEELQAQNGKEITGQSD